MATSAELTVDLAAEVLKAVLAKAASAWGFWDFFAWRRQYFDDYSITRAQEDRSALMRHLTLGCTLGGTILRIVGVFSERPHYRIV
jgi:hypothetical protein